MKYYTKVNPVDGTFPIEYVEVDFTEMAWDIVKSIGVDHANDDDMVRMVLDILDQEPCIMDGVPEKKERPEPYFTWQDVEEMEKWRSTHPYKVEPDVQEQIKHLNRRIGVLESRLGSKRSEAVPAYDEEYWKKSPYQGCIGMTATEELNMRYDKTLERIKHDLKIGGGDDT